jgi:hypothetical protein
MTFGWVDYSVVTQKVEHTFEDYLVGCLIARSYLRLKMTDTKHQTPKVHTGLLDFRGLAARSSQNVDVYLIEQAWKSSFF